MTQHLIESRCYFIAYCTIVTEMSKRDNSKIGEICRPIFRMRSLNDNHFKLDTLRLAFGNRTAQMHAHRQTINTYTFWVKKGKQSIQSIV